MNIGIVLPTVAGREAVFERVYAAYERTCPDGWVFDIITPMDYDTVGKAWQAGVDELVEDFTGDYLFLASDDAEPHPGWAEVAVKTADAGYVPAPRMLFPDGTLESCGSMGFGVLLGESADCTPCRNTGTIFMRRDWWHEVGPVADGHYAIDDLWCWKAALQGHHVLYRSGMVFTHHHEGASTAHVRELALTHNLAALDEMSRVEHPAKTVRTLRDGVIDGLHAAAV